jgi:hypothetical protein
MGLPRSDPPRGHCFQRAGASRAEAQFRPARRRLTGAPGRTRTADAGLRTASLYPLSYGGVPRNGTARLGRAGTAGRWRAFRGKATLPPRMRSEMIDPARPPAEAAAPLPDLVLYGRPGCHLCDDMREVIRALLTERAAAGRPTPRLLERDITTDPELHRAFLTTIPVVELGGRRLELATSAAKIRRLLDEVLEGSWT